MALAVQTTFSGASGVPAGFVSTGSNPIVQSGGIGIAQDTANPSAITRSAAHNADQECAAKLVFSSWADVAVYAKAQSNTDLTANRYLVKAQKVTGSFPDVVSIIKRRNGLDEVVASSVVKRGKFASADQLKIRAFDAGSATVIESYYNGILIDQYVDLTNPIQGTGYVGVWLDANSAGMGVDDFQSGDLTVYWVSPAAPTAPPTLPSQVNGVDDVARNGSFTQPWATIKFGGHKSRMVAQGAVLIVRGANYSNRLNDALTDILFKTGISWDNPTTYSQLLTETVSLTNSGGSAVLALTSASNGVGGTNYVQLIGWEMNGNTTGNGGIFITGKNNHLRFQRMNVHHYQGGGQGLQIAQVEDGTDTALHYIEFLQGSIHDNGVSNLNHGVYNLQSGTIIEDSDVYSNAAYGIQSYTINNTVQRVPGTFNIFRRNRLYKNGSGGLVIGGCHDTLVLSNLVFRNDGHGISTNGATQSSPTVVGPPERTLILLNTVYKNNADLASGYGISLSSNSIDSVIIGNILYKGQNGKTGINEAAVNTTLSSNLNPTKDAVSETDPLFVSETTDAEDFTLQAGSPCIGNSDDLTSTYPQAVIDFNGYTRPAGLQWTQGAIEFPSSALAGAVKSSRIDFTMGFGF